MYIRSETIMPSYLEDFKKQGLISVRGMLERGAYLDPAQHAAAKAWVRMMEELSASMKTMNQLVKPATWVA